MNLNHLLLWLTGVSCGINLLFAVISKAERVRGWIGLLAVLIGLLAAAWYFIPERAGYVVGGLWLLFVVVPGLGVKVLGRLLAVRRYRAAMGLSRFLAWLHPFDGWGEQTQFVRVLRLLHLGQTAEASAALSRMRVLDSPLGRSALVMETQQSGHWQALLIWLQTHPHRGRLMRDESLVNGWLQALGELGRRNDLLHAVGRLTDGRGRPTLPTSNILRMKVLALCGAVAPVEQLLSALVPHLPEDVREYWRLTARQVAGVEGTAAEFQKLRASASPHLEPLITRRLESPLRPLRGDELDATARATRDEWAETVAHEARYAVMTLMSWRRPLATWAIAAVLIGAFLTELPGGSTNTDNLYNLGALVIPTQLTPGEWWRRITAGFLHFGPLHLTLNLLGLLLFAPKLERAWGRTLMVLCYLTATVTSVGLVPQFVRPTPLQPWFVLVGASGGVMGLLGAIIGHLTLGHWRGRSRVVSRQLGSLLLIVCLQTIFDTVTPQVSFTCHALGLATGFLFAMLVGVWHRPAGVT